MNTTQSLTQQSANQLWGIYSDPRLQLINYPSLQIKYSTTTHTVATRRRQCRFLTVTGLSPRSYFSGKIEGIQMSEHLSVELGPKQLEATIQPGRES
jgi:hypothetical protein